MDTYVVNEQIYRNTETGEISQIRQEMSNGSVQWWYDDQPHWSARPTAADAQRESAVARKWARNKRSLP